LASAKACQKGRLPDFLVKSRRSCIAESSGDFGPPELVQNEEVEAPLEEVSSPQGIPWVVIIVSREYPSLE